MIFNTTRGHNLGKESQEGRPHANAFANDGLITNFKSAWSGPCKLGLIEESYLKIREFFDVFVANRAANRPPLKCFENLVLKL